MNKLGQLLIIGLEGKELSQEEKSFLKEENIGGVILFRKNYENPEQLAKLINDIQKQRDEFPLFISVDHEGGRVMRFREHFSQFPPMGSIAKFDSPKKVFEVHSTMAEELALCGINLSYSPVCDIREKDGKDNSIIGDRAFGPTADVVSKYVTAAVRGLQTHGVFACAKHFPGHGLSSIDSHFALPRIEISLDELREEHFLPFHKAIKSRVDFLMVGHLLVTGIDSQLPCSLSENCYQVLRDEFKYKNLIITDDLEMEALNDFGQVEENCLKAINAGTDIVIIRSFHVAKKCMEYLKLAEKEKRILKEQINDRFSRVLKFKEKWLSSYSPISLEQVKKGFSKKQKEDLVEI